jgi:hypothetical protein
MSISAVTWFPPSSHFVRFVVNNIFLLSLNPIQPFLNGFRAQYSHIFVFIAAFYGHSVIEVWDLDLSTCTWVVQKSNGEDLTKCL